VRDSVLDSEIERGAVSAGLAAENDFLNAAHVDCLHWRLATFDSEGYLSSMKRLAQRKASGTGQSSPRRIRLALICADAGMQTRARIDDVVVADYTEAMLAGAQFPPVVVFQSHGQFILADGFHRLRAARKARFDTIAAEVRQGNRLDALRYSLGCNHTHGLRRTNEDKRHAITVALREFSRLSDRMIADLCGVAHASVAAVRGQLVNLTSCALRTGKDGKTRRLPGKPAPKTERPALRSIPRRDGDDALATAAVLRIAESLADLGEAIMDALDRYPSKKATLRSFIAKARNDLAILEKKVTNGP
jgi:ParB-like nuclease domain